MKAYSVDFRQEIIDVHQAEHLSIRALAQRFQVSKHFIETLLKLYRTHLGSRRKARMMENALFQ